ncbi:bacteriocin [Campylobacter troglodytis]|uniref:bacteriocin n=1 Tax=Campylobacter troglodytis TaxID=654363 RepID=UPI00115BDBCC|nr:bacteriocin [Campylobacter troglodytis]TQR53017.1 bacteriocin [Campylobacter troglodytis]
MSKTFFKIAFLSALLSSLSLADDFLAKLTNGALSDNLAGVKVLSEEEASQVVGGYYVRLFDNGSKWNAPDEMYAVAFYSVQNELARGGLCEINLTSCPRPSSRRLVEWRNISNDPYHLATYIVKRHTSYSRNGRFAYFTFGMGVLDMRSGNIYKINNSGMLNNNMVIREISRNYKKHMEDELGGYVPRIGSLR